MKVEDRLLEQAMELVKSFPIDGNPQNMAMYAFKAGRLCGEIEMHFEAKNAKSETDRLKDYVDSIKQDKSRGLGDI